MFWSLFADAPFVPLPREVAEKMVEIAEIKKDDHVIDLGSGHGEIIFAAARKGAQVKGYELSRFLVFITKIRKMLFYRKSDVSIYRGDLFRANIKDNNVVFTYLLPEAMARLADKFKAELAHGTRVVAADFPIPNWSPVKVETIEKFSLGKRIYLYRI